ncbi:guanylate kinase [Nemania sp. NC0429]|nr:guanylate kinase [Nemania sp. NC0429]
MTHTAFVCTVSTFRFVVSDTSPQDHRPVVISGPSGVGKETLIRKLFEAHPDVFTSTVSHTTRAPRSGEVNGVHYHFVSTSEFESLISREAFIEHAVFNGHHYGTGKRTIVEQITKGMVVLFDIEMQGVKQLKARNGFDARYVFVKPPSVEDLEARLRGRGADDEESIQGRLVQARAELEYADTPGAHDIVITNDDVEEAFQKLDKFIYQPVA